MSSRNKEEAAWDNLPAALLRNKAIRNYLGTYTAHEWPEIVKLTLLYGMLALHKQQPVSKQYSVEELRDLITMGYVGSTVTAALPDVANQLDRLRGQVADITADIYLPASKTGGFRQVKAIPTMDAVPLPVEQQLAMPPAQPPHRLVLFAQPPQPASQMQLDQIPASNIAIEPNRVMKDVSNKMDQQRTWSPPGKKRSSGKAVSQEGVEAPNNTVYPSWWGDGSDLPPAQPETKRELKARPPPRLAYTVPPEMVPLYENDLVTSKYLEVEGSGYGQKPQPIEHNRAAPAVTMQAAGPVASQPGPFLPPWQDAHPFSTDPQPHISGAAMPAQPQQVLYALAPNGVMMPVAVNSVVATTPPVTRPPAAGALVAARAATEPAKKHTKRPNWKAVESRIKTQVLADRANAAQKREAKRQEVLNVLYTPGPPPFRQTMLQPAPQLPTHNTSAHHPAHQTAGIRFNTTSSQPPNNYHAAARQPHHATPTPPKASPSSLSGIADSLVSSPWTSWFMGDPEAPEAVTGPSVTDTLQARGYSTVPAGTHLNGFNSLNITGVPHTSTVSVTAQQQPTTAVPAEPQGLFSMLSFQQPHPSHHDGQYNYNLHAVSQSRVQVLNMSNQLPSFNSEAIQEQPFHDLYEIQQLDQDSKPSPAMTVPPPNLPPPVTWDLDEMTMKDIVATRAQQRQQKRADAAGSPRVYPGIRPEVARFAKSWVGDFGHLDAIPRFDFDKPFSHHQQQQQEQQQQPADLPVAQHSTTSHHTQSSPPLGLEAERSSMEMEVEELREQIAEARAQGIAAAVADQELIEASRRLNAVLQSAPVQPLLQSAPVQIVTQLPRPSVTSPNVALFSSPEATASSAVSNVGTDNVTLATSVALETPLEHTSHTTPQAPSTSSSTAVSGNGTATETGSINRAPDTRGEDTVASASNNLETGSRETSLVSTFAQQPSATSTAEPVPVPMPALQTNAAPEVVAATFSETAMLAASSPATSSSSLDSFQGMRHVQPLRSMASDSSSVDTEELFMSSIDSTPAGQGNTTAAAQQDSNKYGLGLVQDVSETNDQLPGAAANEAQQVVEQPTARVLEFAEAVESLEGNPTVQPNNGAGGPRNASLDAAEGSELLTSVTTQEQDELATELQKLFQNRFTT